MDMSKEKYTEVQNTMLKVAKEIQFLRLDLFIDKINSAESLAPMIDPTMYRAAKKNLDIIKKMAEGLIEFQNSLPEMRDLLDGLMDADNYNKTHSSL